jgi:DNA-binding NarL/FixJ family response regulator
VGSNRAVIAATTTSIRGEIARDTWGLTEPEAGVLELLAQGHTNDEIAAALDSAPGMVENHVRGMLRKANATNRTMLVYRFWTLETDGIP